MNDNFDCIFFYVNQNMTRMETARAKFAANFWEELCSCLKVSVELEQ